MTDRQPPTTTWGALLAAANILERSAASTGLDPYAALQDALWPPPEAVPLDPAGQVRGDDTTGRLYWGALGRLDVTLGGTGHGELAAIGRLLKVPGQTVAAVVDAMRQAACSTTARKVVG